MVPVDEVVVVGMLDGLGVVGNVVVGGIIVTVRGHGAPLTGAPRSIADGSSVDCEVGPFDVGEEVGAFDGACPGSDMPIALSTGACAGAAVSMSEAKEASPTSTVDSARGRLEGTPSPA